MDFSPIIKARKVLNSLWQEASLKGRCWGLAKRDNPYSATNITIAIGTELVSVSQGKDGKLRIHQFTRAKGTSLGRRVKRILRNNKLSFE